MTRDDDRIDLSALDPETDPDRLERVTTGILERLGPGIVDEPALLRHRVPQLLAGRFPTLFGTAALVAAVAAVLLVRSVAPPAAPLYPATGLGFPDDSAVWLFTGSVPRTENLLFLVAGEDR